MTSARAVLPVVGLVWLLLPGPAPAQEASASRPSAEPRAPEFAPAVAVAASEAGAEGAARGLGTEEPRQLGEADQMRWRWGLGAFGGPFFPATSLCFPLGRMEYRLGARMNPWLAVLGTMALALGAGAWDGMPKLAGWTSVGVLAELTLFDRLFIAGGPGVALGGWGTFNASETVLPDEVSGGGVLFTANVRLGIALGESVAHTRRRGPISVGLDVLFLFGRGSQREWNDDRPSESFRAVDAVAFVPALTLGYDAR